MKKEEEVLSPEGVEEIVKFETTFRITLTGGGKYRIYAVDFDKAMSIKSCDSLEDAKKELGFGMILNGGMLSDPKKMIDTIVDKLSGK